MKTLGRENIQRGPKLIAVTRYLRPSGRGLASLARELEKMRGGPKDATFTYSLVVKDMKGKTLKTREGLILPTRREQRIMGERARTPRGRLIKLFEDRIRAEVFMARPGLTKTQYDRLAKLRERSASAARTYLQGLLREKGVTFKVKIFREI